MVKSKMTELTNKRVISEEKSYNSSMFDYSSSLIGGAFDIIVLRFVKLNLYNLCFFGSKKSRHLK